MQKRTLPPNFLFFDIPRLTLRDTALFAFLGLAVLGSFLFFRPVFIALCLVLLAAFFLWRRTLALGLFAVLGLALGLVVDFSRYSWAKEVPYLPTINAPLGDFFAVLLLAGFVFLALFSPASVSWKKFKRLLPGIALYGLFVIISALSVFFAYDYQFSVSARAFLRTVLFVFPAFALLPVFLIDEWRAFEKIFRIWFWVGIAAVVFGLLSLFAGSPEGWIRLYPATVFGIAPFRTSQNSLAEVLLLVLPAALYLFDRSDQHKKKFYGFGAAAIALVALLTLSRTAWIVLFFYAAWYFRRHVRYMFHHADRERIALVGLAALLPIFFYMAFFLRSSVVSSSTTARLAEIQVVSFYVLRAPWFGYGPGMYTSVLADTYAFVADFGEPLDAHGIIQKVALETGVVGLVFLSGFFAWLFITLRRLMNHDEERRHLYETVFLTVFGALAFQLFSTSYFTSILWLPVGLSFAAIALAKSHHSIFSRV